MKIIKILQKYKYLIIIGLVLRIVISGITYHQDAKQQVVATRAYLNGQFNPYSEAPKDPERGNFR